MTNETEPEEKASGLDRLLAAWEAAFGPVPERELNAARVAFDRLDGEDRDD